MFVFIIFGIFVHYATAQYDCKDFLDAPVRNVTIYDFSDDVIDSIYINDIEDVLVDESAYIEAFVDNNYLIIRKTADLEKFIEHEIYVGSVTLVCEDDDYRLDYNVKVELCHGIKFKETEYSFPFYGFMEKGDEMNLLAFGRIDIKCGVGSVKFDIVENDYFAMDYEGSGIIVALQDIIPPPIFNETFTVLGWDDSVSKDDPVITSVQIVIKPTYESPIGFTDTSYYGYIDSNLDIIIENGPIALETGIDISDTYIEITSEYVDFFDVKYSDNEIILVLTTEPSLANSLFENDTITLMVTAYDVRSFDNSAVAFVTLDTILLKQHDASSTLPSFILANGTEEIDGVFEDIKKEAGKEEEKEEERKEAEKEREDEEKEKEEDNEFKEIYINSSIDKFTFWVLNTKSLIIMLMIICGVTILSAIAFLRSRMPSRRVVY